MVFICLRDSALAYDFRGPHGLCCVVVTLPRCVCERERSCFDAAGMSPFGFVSLRLVVEASPASSPAHTHPAEISSCFFYVFLFGIIDIDDTYSARVCCYRYQRREQSVCVSEKETHLLVSMARFINGVFCCV